MSNLVRAQLFTLASTRAPWAISAGTAAFAALSALLAVAGAGRHLQPSIGTAGAALGVLAGFGRGSLAALVLGTLLVTTEYRHGTVTATLLHAPRRLRLAAAKALVAGLVTTALGLLCLVLCVAVGAAGRAVGPGQVSGALALHALGLLLAYPAYGLLGVGIGLLLPRFQAAAVVLPAAWILVLEDVALGSVLQRVPAWGLARVTAAAAAAPDVYPLLPAWAGALVLLGYVAAVSACGAAWFIRSDVA